MREWNSDISKAPRGKFVVVNRKYGRGSGDGKVFRADDVVIATACGVVTISHYLVDEHRWMFMQSGEQPIAWMPAEGLPTETVIRNGKSREVVVLPAHPTMAESWFKTLLRERIAA